MAIFDPDIYTTIHAFLVTRMYTVALGCRTAPLHAQHLVVLLLAQNFGCVAMQSHC
jgi:hypothetical protein